MNDLRITQYALGELDGVEREAFERELAASDSLQSELQEITNLTTILKLYPMNTDTLTETQRDTLKLTSYNNLEVSKSRTRRSRIVIVLALGALAACLLLVPFSLMTLFFGANDATDPSNPVASATPAPEASPIALNEAETNLPADSDNLMGNLSAMAESATRNAGSLPSTGLGAQINFAWSNITALADGGEQGLSHLREYDEIVRSTGSTTGRRTGSGTGYHLNAASGQNPSPGQQFVVRIAPRGEITMNRAGIEAGGHNTEAYDVVTFGGQRTVTFGGIEAGGHNTEAYDAIQGNEFLTAKENPLSTFSIDVDTASYANVRRFLLAGQFPPDGAVRTEELINYFPYAYPLPDEGQPFSVNLETSRAPWAPDRVLVRIGLKGKEIAEADRAPANLVFLIDVSGSMNAPDKLPLLKQSLQKLVENLSERDHVAMVTYAGSSGLVLPSTPGREKARILAALENLEAGGSTNGASGISLAYQTAREHFLKEGNNRVILCTDGDFNVGTTSESELVALIEKERASGVFLSVLGFGTGNLKDSTMEKLADNGNGNYAYIDSLSEGRKVLVEQMGATLFTIAKDVKIQVEFNPAQVSAYRLIGYENRLLTKEDFRDDTKDAGDIGAGHSVTALYEVIPAGKTAPGNPQTDPLKYQKPDSIATDSPVSRELLTVKLSYKEPDGKTSKLIEMPLSSPEIAAFDSASPDFQFATAVAAFGMKLRGSPETADFSWSDIQAIVRRSLGEDPGSYRAEFLTLLEKASRLTP